MTITSKILVTGASGFVGNTLCRSLNKAGYLVQTAQRHKGKDFNFTTVNINEKTNWSAALSGQDCVIHLAAHIRNMPYDSLIICRKINTEGTLRLARQAAMVGVKRFIFLSSAKVNGEGQSLPYTETDLPMPQESYAISKWEAEQGLSSISAETGLEVVILRPPLVYGPGVKANFLRLMHTINKKIPLPLGCIRNCRSFIYVENLISAITTCLTHPAAANNTFFVSDGEDISTPALIHRLAAVMGRPSFLLPIPIGWLKCIGILLKRSQEVDKIIGSFTINIKAIQHKLNWYPPFSMQEGLDKTAIWYRDNYVR